MEKSDNVKSKITPMICDISGIYGQMYDVDAKVNMTDISGTNCYCDDKAAEVIRERIFACSPGEKISKIHLIDSGNYHYLSYFFMERIGSPFALVMIDNHTDMQPPGFGRILSCGGWVEYALEECENLKQVYLFGMSKEHLDEAGELPEKVRFLDHRELADGGAKLPALGDLPIYISIDKDALSSDFAATDWDQGDMTLDELVKLLEVIMAGHTIIGVDICGEKKEAPTDEEIKKNIDTNYKLLEVISRNM